MMLQKGPNLELKWVQLDILPIGTNNSCTSAVFSQIQTLRGNFYGADKSQEVFKVIKAIRSF